MKKGLKAIVALAVGITMVGSVAAVAGCSKDSSHTHVAATEWTQDTTNHTHYHACTVEGCTERLDEEACAKATGATIQSDETNHWYKCGECDQPIEVTAHNFTETNDATYLAAGTVTKTCADCGKVVTTNEVAAKKTMTVGSTSTLTGTAASKTLTAAQTGTTISLKYDTGSVIGYMDLDTTNNTAKIKICMIMYTIPFVIMANSADDVDATKGEQTVENMFVALGEGTLTATETGYTATWGTGDSASTYIITKGSDNGYTATLDKTTNSGGFMAAEGMSDYFQDMYDVNYAVATVSLAITWGENNTASAVTLSVTVEGSDAVTAVIAGAFSDTDISSYTGVGYDMTTEAMDYTTMVFLTLSADGSLSAMVAHSTVYGYPTVSCAAPTEA